MEVEIAAKLQYREPKAPQVSGLKAVLCTTPLAWSPFSFSFLRLWRGPLLLSFSSRLWRGMKKGEQPTKDCPPENNPIRHRIIIIFCILNHKEQDSCQTFYNKNCHHKMLAAIHQIDISISKNTEMQQFLLISLANIQNYHICCYHLAILLTSFNIVFVSRKIQIVPRGKKVTQGKNEAAI